MESPEGFRRAPRLDEEDRTREDRVELPYVLVGPVEEVDRHLVVRLDRDGFLRLLDGEVVFVDGNALVLGLAQDFQLDLLNAFDGAEGGLFLQEVRERGGSDL